MKLRLNNERACSPRERSDTRRAQFYSGRRVGEACSPTVALPRYNRGVLRARALTGDGWETELEGPWKALVSESSTATPFQTWEWQTTWWKHYARTRRPYILGVYEGEDLIGLMPLMISRGPWRTLRAMCSGASDYLHPLVRSGYEASFAELLQSHLRELSEVDLIDLHQLRETTPLAGLMQGGKVLEQATCLVLDLPATFDAYLATLNKSLRFDVRKLDKELFISGRAFIEEVGLAELDRAMETFFETHRKRWRKRGLPGAFVGSRSERFHREWGELAARNGWLWMAILHFDGNAVGVIYAMRLGSTCFYYQAGMDPAASAISPGSLLVGHTIRRAITEGLSTFDFLRGDEPYKRRWKPQHEYKNLRFIVRSGGLMGKMGEAWNEAGSKVEEKVRARLEGGSLLGNPKKN